jgi:probable HAF family extracellular repeat protein
VKQESGGLLLLRRITPRSRAVMRSIFTLALIGSSVPVDLGNLGGKINNAAFSMNDREQVVDTSDLEGDQYQHAFLWQKGVITDLGTLQGDVVSAGRGINNRGQVAGVSQDANGNDRAFLWQNGQMYDLNSLIPPNSPLYLMHAFGINSSGEIVGFAYNSGTGNIDAYLAVPVNFGGGASSSSPVGGAAPKVILPEKAKQQIQRRVRFRQFALQAVKAETDK